MRGAKNLQMPHQERATLLGLLSFVECTAAIRGVMIPIFFGIGIGITFISRKLVGIGIGIDGVIFTTGFGSNAGIGFTAGIGSTTKIGLINVPASK